MPETLSESTPPLPPAGAGAQQQKAEDTPEADTVARGGQCTALAPQGAAEYELICSSACLQCLGLTGACAA